MQITLGAETICDGADRSVDKSAGPADLVVSGPISMQVGEFLRATAIQAFNRNNLRSEVSFGIKRQLSTVAAAAMYCFSHPAGVTRSGTLAIADGVSTASIANCVLETCTCRQIGCTVLVDYKLTGGAITIT